MSACHPPIRTVAAAFACPHYPTLVEQLQAQRSQQNKNMKNIRIIPIVAAITAAFISSQVFAHEGEDHGKGGASAVPKTYPLTKCVVSDEKLGEHGKPVKVTSKGTDVWLCCKSCAKDFNKDPEKYAKMVRDAQAHAKK